MDCCSCWIGIAIIAVIGLYFGKIYISGGVCNIKKDLRGQVVFITGANTGIGKETALQLSQLGATIIIACRDQVKGKAVVDQIKQNVHMLKLDLSDFASVRQCVVQFQALKIDKIDILINNAAIMAPQTYEITKQGHESQFGTNHLGHFLLTELLMPYIKKAQNGRVVNVSSIAHVQFAELDLKDLNSTKYANSKLWSLKYNYVCYGNSKLCNILHAQEIPRRHGVQACSLHPGVVRTELMRFQLQNRIVNALLIIFNPIWLYFTKSALQGAQTSLYCALADIKNGAYYKDCKEFQPVKTSPEIAKELWERSLELVK